MYEYLIKNTTLTDIADAIREKTDDTQAITASNMAIKILDLNRRLINYEYTRDDIEITDYAFADCTNLFHVNLPEIEKLRAGVFENCSALKIINTPNLYSIQSYAFRGCTSLETIRLSSSTRSYIYSNAFTNCSNLKTLILPYASEVAYMISSSVLYGTPIAKGTGYIYVADELVDSYKTNSMWSSYANQIRPISEYIAPPPVDGVVICGTLPEGAYYIDGISNKLCNEIPTKINSLDIFVYGDYMYRYYATGATNGWEVSLALESFPLLSALLPNYDFVSRLARSYGPILKQIGSKNVTSLEGTFSQCYELIEAPDIPYSVTDMSGAFYHCQDLTKAPAIPNRVTNMKNAFIGCIRLTEAPVIPNSVIDMTNTFKECEKLVIPPNMGNANNVTNMESTFNGCKSLTMAPVVPNCVTNMQSTFNGCESLIVAPVIPNSVTNMANTFRGCKSLVEAPVIPNNVTNMYYTFNCCESLIKAPAIPNSVTKMYGTFKDCIALTGSIHIDANPPEYYDCFAGTQKPITLVGSSTMLAELAATANNGNVTVG